tara:strand:+ start:2146 stop:2427 length:282 start_codon:yes stop_codon:yes gene_type:complete
MDTTFNIENFDKDRLSGPATWNQCDAIGKKFAKRKDGSIDWRRHKQIRACLYNEIKQGNLHFDYASNLISTAKKLPKKYADKITGYLADNLEA